MRFERQKRDAFRIVVDISPTGEERTCSLPPTSRGRDVRTAF